MKTIIIEKPLNWMSDINIGPSVTKLYDTIFNLLKSSSIKFDTTDLFYPKIGDDRAEFYRRTPNFDFATHNCLSYHTWGDHKDGLWRMKESYLPNYYIIDELGYSGFSHFSNHQSMCNEIEYTKNIKLKILEFNNNQSLNNISKYNQQNHIEINYDSYIFLPLQSFIDSVIKLSRFKYYDILDTIADNISYPILIKPHPHYYPEELKTYLHNLVKKNRNIIITHCSIHSLIPKSLCCMCINSGVGFESLLYGKPVISFGKSDYDSCTYQCNNLSEINNKIVEYAKNYYLDNQAYIYKFLYYYINKYCINALDETDIYEKIIKKIAT